MPSLSTVLLYATLAAAAGAVGAIPATLGHALDRGQLAWGRALAAGLMLGATYLLTQESVALAPFAGASGSLLGVLTVAAWQRWTAIDASDDERTEGPGAEDSRAILRRGALHSGAEGIAMGAAFMIHTALGIFIAAALALHNIPEGGALVSGLTRRGRAVGTATVSTLVVKASQPLLAGLTVAFIALVPPALPWMLGLASGAMFYLLLVDLLPQSYRHRGHVDIAIITSVALSAIVLLRHYVVVR